MKELTIKIDEASAKIVAEMLEHYNKPLLKKGEEQDPFKDNGYMIKAIDKFVKAYEESKDEKSNDSL